MRYVLDTNVALYLLGGRLLKPLPVGEFFLSVISEMEMLSYSAITSAEEGKIRQFLTQVTVLGVDEVVKHATISLRKPAIINLKNLWPKEPAPQGVDYS